jgi:hypothetical protein
VLELGGMYIAATLLQPFGKITVLKGRKEKRGKEARRSNAR